MTFRAQVVICLTLCAISVFAGGQATAKPASIQDLDFPGLVKETQQSPNEPGYAGLVWWIPTEYWEISAQRTGMSEEVAKQRFGPLRKYTVVAVAVGKIGIGNVNWISEPEVKENVLLRDSEGNTYPPVQKLSGDAEGLVSILKPGFTNLLGNMGQNIQLLFFPASNKMARPIADPLAPGSFTVLVTKLMNGKDKALEWKLPLTSLSPPKYCPVGKERMQANWKYCPWHGVKLDEARPFASTAAK